MSWWPTLPTRNCSSFPQQRSSSGLSFEQLAARALVEGANFYFGKNRAGDAGRLAELCEGTTCSSSSSKPLQHEGGIVSSSRIRQTIASGNVELAATMLTRPYRVRGMVTHGAQRGGGLGFPTANLEAIDTLIPGDGVYAGRAHVRGESYPGRRQRRPQSDIFRSSAQGRSPPDWLGRVDLRRAARG